jgi:hypothetical protein
MAKPTTGEPKKLYSPPVLTVYGTVQQLTQAVSLIGASDHTGRGFKIRTHAG